MTHQELLNEFMDLQKEFSNLEDRYRELFDEMESLKSSKEFGGIFIFEDGSKKFISFMQKARGIKNGPERPIDFKLNFNQQMLINWIEECKSTLDQKALKESKVGELLPDGKRRK